MKEFIINKNYKYRFCQYIHIKFRFSHVPLILLDDFTYVSII